MLTTPKTTHLARFQEIAARVRAAQNTSGCDESDETRRNPPPQAGSGLVEMPISAETWQKPAETPLAGSHYTSPKTGGSRKAGTT